MSDDIHLQHLVLCTRAIRCNNCGSGHTANRIMALRADGTWEPAPHSVLMPGPLHKITHKREEPLSIAACHLCIGEVIERKKAAEPTYYSEPLKPPPYRDYGMSRAAAHLTDWAAERRQPAPTRKQEAKPAKRALTLAEMEV